MSKFNRGAKLTLLFLLNPHRFALALSFMAADCIGWVAEKLEGVSRWLEDRSDLLLSKSPLFGEEISSSLENDYREERKENNRRACEAILPASQRSDTE